MSSAIAGILLQRKRQETLFLAESLMNQAVMAVEKSAQPAIKQHNDERMVIKAKTSILDVAEGPTTRSICDVYDVEGYSSMNADIARNKFFVGAIKASTERIYTKQRIIKTNMKQSANWLEIGCGASALLTRKVLDTDYNSTVTAFETNITSASCAKRVLRDNDIYAHRYSIIESCSSDRKSDKEANRNISTDALLFEIFGFIASSEGVLKSVSDLKEAWELGIDVEMVPQRAATFFAPVELSSKLLDMTKGPLYASDRLVLASRLNFAESMLSSKVGKMESFDFRDSAIDFQEHTTRFDITKAGHATGLGAFLTLATTGLLKDFRRWPKSIFHPKYTDKYIWVSSNFSDTNAATSWRNPVILFENPIDLSVGDVLEVIASSNLGNGQPEYNFKINIKKTENDTFSSLQSLRLTMSDLYPDYYQYKSSFSGRVKMKESKRARIN